jgi:integrase
MPLHLRLRGVVWHARGTVRIGRKTVEVPEFSTGMRRRADAEAVAADEEARVRADHLDGDQGRTRRLTIADCLKIYLKRPGGVPQYDKDRLADLSARIGDRLLSEAKVAWGDWLRTRGNSMAPATAARWRAILQAAIGAGCAAHDLPAPRLPTVKVQDTEGVVFLTRPEQDRLLAAYGPTARPVATVLCFAGLRSQEALQLDWRHVSLTRRMLTVTAGHSKSGKGRSVPMHDRVHAELLAIWEAAGRPATGPVFISAHGQPFADTRARGGNPLAKSHATACRRAGITGFRVHDWRHHWASWMTMSGTDQTTLMRLGGWSTPRMVQRYAAVSAEHMADAIRRLA